MDSLGCDPDIVGFRVRVGDPGWNKVRVVAARAILEALDQVHRCDGGVRLDLAVKLNPVEEGCVGGVALKHLNVDRRASSTPPETR